MKNIFKDVMGNYPTGVTVVTTMDIDSPVGLTVNSFASVSMEPLLVLWSIDKKSRSLASFIHSERFAINILSEHQKDICYLFANSDKEDRFREVKWYRSENDLPVLEHIFGVMECKKYLQIDAGDHFVIIGKVIRIEKEKDKPLLYYNRKVQPILEMR